MIYAFNHFTLDTHLFELRRQNKKVAIEPQVFNVLVYLLCHRHRVVSKEELLDALWRGRVVSDSSLNTCIKVVRKAVDDTGREQGLIKTSYRRGYRFVAPVEVDGDEAQSRKVENVDAPPSDMDEKGVRETNSALSVGEGADDDRLSIVLLPFNHNSVDDETLWWAEVFAEDVGIHLARIPGFQVISSHSVMAFDRNKMAARDVGLALKTRYAVDGAVRRFKHEYRISVQLLEVQSGRLIWANHKKLAMHEIEDHQGKIAQKLVAQIEPELNRAEFVSLHHRQPSDYTAWSRCRETTVMLGQKGWNEQTFAEAISLLKDAIERDPQLAFAHAYLSLIIALGHLIGLVGSENWQQEATQAAEQALALDSQNSDVLGHAGCAFADMGDFNRGIPLLQRALEINPGNAQAWAALGAARMRTGDECGAEDMRRGIKLSPRDTRLAPWGALLALGLLSYGHVAESIEAAHNACLYDDKIFLPRAVLAMACCSGGDKQASIDAWQDARRIRPQLCLDDISWMANQQLRRQMQAYGLA